MRADRFGRNPKRHVAKSASKTGSRTIFKSGLHDPVSNRRDGKRPVLIRPSRFGDHYPAREQRAVPARLSQPGGYALGAQAGEAAIREVITHAGFTRFRRVAESPFNAVYEVRP